MRRIWLHLLKKSLIEDFIFLCSVTTVRDDTHMTSTVRGVGVDGGEGKNKMLLDVGGEGGEGSECSGRPFFIILLKKIGFAP